MGWIAENMRKLKIDIARKAKQDWDESPQWARDAVLREDVERQFFDLGGVYIDSCWKSVSGRHYATPDEAVAEMLAEDAAYRRSLDDETMRRDGKEG